MRPDIAEEALPFSEKETQGNGWRFPKRKTSEQSEHCSDVEKDTSLIQNAHGSLVPVCSVCFVHTLGFSLFV
mgnify:CR=1 FL=1